MDVVTVPLALDPPKILVHELPFNVTFVVVAPALFPPPYALVTVPPLTVI